MKDQRSRLEIKMAAAKRLFMLYFLSKKLGLINVLEYPKSGGTWFCEMLSEVLGVPFPRNVAPKLQKSIMHNHYLFHPRFGRAIGILRDGRDIAVSAYYHFLHENDRNPKAMVAMHRKALPFSDYDDIRTNLPEFIHYLFEVYSQGVTHSSWSDHVRSCLGSTSVCVVKYEDLLAKPSKELIKACEFLNEKPDLAIIDEVINNHSFASKSKRKPGDENSASFLRKGIAGDWKNHFSIESCQVFNKFGGKELIMAGYESDDSWIKNWVE